MNKKLSLKFQLENGKKANFSLSNIKNVPVDDASGYLKALNYNQIFEVKGQRVEKLVEAEMVTTSSEKISLD